MLKRLFPILLCSVFGLTACAGVASAGSQPRILPLDCRVDSGSSVALSLDGVLPQNAGIRWEVSAGSIVSTGQGLNSVFTAPNIAADVIVSAYISSGTPGSSSEPVTRNCSVVAPTFTPVNASQSTALSPGSTSTPGGPTVAISEVMASPCGDEDFKKWNEYVELYNYGDQPQDVGGWWVVDKGPDNKPDMLVAWETRNPDELLNQSAVTDTTIIPPHGFALVLSPIYTQGLQPYKMPYRFPISTIVLTIAESDRIGDDYYALIGQGAGRDVVVLYIGGPNTIRQVISTYGSPLLGKYPQDIRDDRADNLPLDLHKCSSAERTDPRAADVFSKWREVLNGSPGEAPYP